MLNQRDALKLINQTVAANDVAVKIRQGLGLERFFVGSRRVVNDNGQPQAQLGNIDRAGLNVAGEDRIFNRLKFQVVQPAHKLIGFAEVKISRQNFASLGNFVEHTEQERARPDS